MRDVLSYLYVNATVMAKEGKFIPQSRWEDLWGATSPGEVASLLEATDYFPYLSEGAVSDARELEKAILAEFSVVGKEIAKIIPRGAWPIRKYLLRKWDVINLRTAIRGMHSGAKKEDILASLVEGGELDATFLRTIVDAEGMEDLVGMLTRTPYHSLSQGLARYSETNNLFFLESLLDKAFWENLWLEVLNRRASKGFREFLEVCVETHNLKIILRAKQGRLLREEIELCLIPECKILDELLVAFDEEDIAGLLPLLDGTPYFESLVSRQPEYESTGFILVFEEMLDGAVVARGEDIRKKRPFGPGPLIGFLFAKEMEVRNLLALVRSTEVALNREEVREAITRNSWKSP
ncbi:MAG: V-type ATPase subunit [Deltaproteobacteria bacterium]|nr:MAG: V-type ATPase subunit [Deltaproteobacteria bacterium]